MLVSEIEKHFREFRPAFVKRMYFRSGSHEGAEDIVQEAYCRVLKYKDSFVADEFSKYFNTILNNCLRDWKNQENGHTNDLFDEELAEGTACPHYSEHVMKEVFELISTKSVSQQEILTMYFKYEYPAIDISNATAYSYAHCHKVISRFRQELKELYE